MTHRYGLKAVLRSTGGASAMSAAIATLLLACAPAAIASARGSELPRAVQQGALVIGRTHPGNRVRLGERDLRVDMEGRFVFGVGRDASEPVRLEIAWFDGAQEWTRVHVLPRDWPVERIEGVPQETVTPPPEIAERIAREQAQVTAARVRDDARSDYAAAFIWPVEGRISGRFGRQRVYNGTPKAPHSGMDIAAKNGTPVRAPAAGIVTFADPGLYLTGGTVLIDHGAGVSSNFLHLSRIDVRVGQRIEQGETLGAVGATGRATGPHLHWGMNWFDVRVDPQLVLEASGVAVPEEAPVQPSVDAPKPNPAPVSPRKSDR